MYTIFSTQTQSMPQIEETQSLCTQYSAHRPKACRRQKQTQSLYIHNIQHTDPKHATNRRSTEHIYTQYLAYLQGSRLGSWNNARNPRVHTCGSDHNAHTCQTSVRQCETVWDSVRQCEAVWDSVRQRETAWDSVRLCEQKQLAGCRVHAQLHWCSQWACRRCETMWDSVR